jgi:hypothetical protein
MQNRNTNRGGLSIVPVFEESRIGRADDALPVIWWNEPRGVAGRTRTSRSRYLTKTINSVRVHVRKLEAEVTELEQLVRINF